MMRSPPGAAQCPVIEDDAMIAMLYAEVLVQIGHQVCGMASTEDQAVILAERLLRSHHRRSRLREGSGMMAIRRSCGTENVPHLYVTGSDCSSGPDGRPVFHAAQPFSEQQLVEAMQCAMAVPEPGRPVFEHGPCFLAAPWIHTRQPRRFGPGGTLCAPFQPEISTT